MIAVLSRGAAAVGISSVLVFTVPATAQAFDVGQAARVTTGILGGVGAASPGVLAAAGTAEAGAVAATAVTCAASVICGGAVLAIAVGTVAYATKDTWVPWVKSWATGSAVAVPGSGGGDYPMTVTMVNYQSGQPNNYFGYNWASTGPYSGGGVYSSYTYQGSWQCRSPNGALSEVYTFWAGAEQGANRIRGTDGSVAKVVGCGTERPTGWTSPDGGLDGAKIDNFSFWTYQSQNGGNYSNKIGIGSTADPTLNSVTTNKVCERPDGTTYTDARSATNVTDYIPVGYCLPGDKAISLGVSVQPPGGGSPIVTQTIPLTPTLTDVQAYPLCASAGCEYQILLDGVPCKVGKIGCTSWAATYAATPARVTGRYGPYEYSPADLTWLTHAYDSSTGTKIGTTTATGGQEAGEPTPEVGVEAPGLTDPQPIPPGTAGAECWPTGIARWNPGDWVLAPVKCALTWAFVPSTATLTGLVDGVTADVNRTGIPAVVTAIGVPLTSLPAGNAACLGPGVSLPQLGQDTPFHPFSACAEPIKTAAAISYALSTVVIVVGGGLTLMRLAGAGFGFNVAVKGGGS